MTKDNNVSAEKTEGSPVSGAFNLIACVLYVAAAALFALYVFLGIRLIPSFTVLGLGTDLTFAAVFLAGVIFSLLARKSNMLVKGICALSIVLCGAGYWYVWHVLTENGPMGLREYQLMVGDYLIKQLSGSEKARSIARVGKYTDVQIDMDSREHERDSDRFGDTFTGRVRVEFFPRKKESTVNNVTYANSPLLIWYDVKVFCSDNGDKLMLDSCEMNDKDINKFLKATGLAESAGLALEDEED